jgi:type II secretory pathway component PulF
MPTTNALHRLEKSIRTNWLSLVLIGAFVVFVFWAYKNNYSGMRETIDSFFKDYSKK